MSLTLVNSSVEDYARALRADGEGLITVEDRPWRRIRPGFYRPIMAWCTTSAPKSGMAWDARLGGYQFMVEDAVSANSSLGFLLFEDAQVYDRSKLRRSRRWEINNACKRFQVESFASAEEFSRQAHPIYREFYERTGYRFRRDRFNFSGFMTWAEQIFRDPGATLFGAYDDNRLSAVGIVRVIDRTLVYTSFFASREGLSHHVTSFMLHSIRQAVAERGDIDRIILGTPKNTAAARSVDQFYLNSGCQIKWYPAMLHLNPLLRWSLPRLAPRLYQQIKGSGTDA